MYALMMTIRTLPSRFEQGVRIFRESIVPAIEARKGFQGFFMLVNRENHEIVVIILWDTSEHRMASERDGFIDQQLAKLTNILREPPFGNIYDLELMS
jgi:heme-degrading monooxygenase HmoA